MSETHSFGTRIGHTIFERVTTLLRWAIITASSHKPSTRRRSENTAAGDSGEVCIARR
jgi:hypothetical protein